MTPYNGVQNISDKVTLPPIEAPSGLGCISDTEVQLSTYFVTVLPLFSLRACMCPAPSPTFSTPCCTRARERSQLNACMKTHISICVAHLFIGRCRCAGAGWIWKYRLLFPSQC